MTAKRIEVLFFEGCPNHLPAVELARSIADELGVDAVIDEVEVHAPEQAQELKFLGSPSIRVDGVDVEPAARSRTDYGYSCRTYGGAGLPTGDAVRAAIGGSTSGGNEAAISFAFLPPAQAATGLSLISAAVASACCWLPLGLVAVGLSAGGVGALFEQTRPLFLGLAGVSLAFAFYTAYLRKEVCAPGSACEAGFKRTQRINRGVFWAASVGVIAFAAFPLYVDALTTDDAPAALQDTIASIEPVTIAVSGMTCEGCSSILQKDLGALPGILQARVDHDAGTASLWFSGDSPYDWDALLGAVAKAGFEGALPSD